MTRPLQHFTDDYLVLCRSMTPMQICRFLDDFRQLQLTPQRAAKRKAISIRIPIPLLTSFKQKAQSRGLRYQTVIQELMSRWLLERE